MNDNLLNMELKISGFRNCVGINTVIYIEQIIILYHYSLTDVDTLTVTDYLMQVTDIAISL